MMLSEDFGEAGKELSRETARARQEQRNCAGTGKSGKLPLRAFLSAPRNLPEQERPDGIRQESEKTIMWQYFI